MIKTGCQSDLVYCKLRRNNLDSIVISFVLYPLSLPEQCRVTLYKMHRFWYQLLYICPCRVVFNKQSLSTDWLFLYTGEVFHGGKEMGPWPVYALF